MTYSPERLMEMDTVEFIKTCKKENVTNLKVIENLLVTANLEMTTILQKDMDLVLNLYTGKKIAQTDNFLKLLQNIISIGAVIGQIKERKEIAHYIFVDKTPDCFKKTATTQEKLDK